MLIVASEQFMFLFLVLIGGIINQMFTFPGNDGLHQDYATEEMFNMLWSVAIVGYIILGILIVMMLLRWLVNGREI
jgi:hypothetical protein